MDHFLIYIIISSLVTLLSIMCAYKPEDKDLGLVDLNLLDLDAITLKNATVYNENTKEVSKANNELQASLSI